MGPVPVGREVNHIDGDKDNNRADNLEYITHKQNMKHIYAVVGKKISKRGCMINTAVLTDDDIPAIRQLIKRGYSQRQIGALYGVSGTAISNIKTGKNWTHVQQGKGE